MELFFIILIFTFGLSISYINNIRIFQQNEYDIKKYIKWIINNFSFSKMPIILIFVIISGLIFTGKFLNYILLFIIFLYFIYNIFIFKKKILIKYKKPLVYTKRIYRFLLTSVSLYVLILFFLIDFKYYHNDLSKIFFVIFILSFIQGFIYFFIILVTVINYPIEKYIGSYYIKKAKKKIESRKDLKKIGITGSYGKTSTKNILNNLLKIKYYPCMTPRSYNTPFGITKTINEKLMNINDVFICEMGAYKKTEILELSNIVQPQYGIITSIGPQHLETFKNMDNIVSTKFELIEKLPKTGIAVLNYDNKYIRNYKIRNSCNIVTIGCINNEVDFYARNIYTDLSGTTFDVVFPDKSIYTFNIPILGKHNVINTLASIALSYYLDIQPFEMQKGLNNIKQVKNRLEIINRGNYIILDDSFNSNPEGTKYAVDFINNLNIKGKKIIITPGMVELGNEQYNFNYKYGKYISEKNNIDYVIIVGETNKNALYDGLSINMEVNNLFVVGTIQEAFIKLKDILCDDSIVLLSNDLPDIYK